MRYLLFISVFLSCSGFVKSQYLKNLSGQAFTEEVLESVLYTTKGEKTSLGQVLDSLKGKIVLIDFWASWCRTCVGEAPHILRLQKEYAGKKLAFLFLSTDIDYKQWLKGLSVINLDGFHYRIDPESKKNIQNYLKIRGIPYFVLLDKESKIYDPKAPWPHIEKLKNELDMLLNLY
jgi:thiol-disulfide isomerase/thioredoxin